MLSVSRITHSYHGSDNLKPLRLRGCNLDWREKKKRSLAMSDNRDLRLPSGLSCQQADL